MTALKSPFCRFMDALKSSSPRCSALKSGTPRYRHLFSGVKLGPQSLNQGRKQRPFCPTPLAPPRGPAAPTPVAQTGTSSAASCQRGVIDVARSVTGSTAARKWGLIGVSRSGTCSTASRQRGLVGVSRSVTSSVAFRRRGLVGRFQEAGRWESGLGRVGRPCYRSVGGDGDAYRFSHERQQATQRATADTVPTKYRHVKDVRRRIKGVRRHVKDMSRVSGGMPRM